MSHDRPPFDPSPPLAAGAVRRRRDFIVHRRRGTGRRNRFLNIAPRDLAPMCGSNIVPSFVGKSYDRADIIVVALDSYGKPRGFATLYKKRGKRGVLVLDLICRDKKPRRTTRQRTGRSPRRTAQRGIGMLEFIKRFAHRNHWKTIELHALTSVMGYYLRAGWRFPPRRSHNSVRAKLEKRMTRVATRKRMNRRSMELLQQKYRERVPGVYNSHGLEEGITMFWHTN